MGVCMRAYCTLLCGWRNCWRGIIFKLINWMENTNAFEFFKEEMDVDDIAVRVNTVHKLPIIATLMTPDAIKNQLIPFLDALTKKEDDEVVFAITEEYANIAALLGSPQQTIVMPYLEALCAHDETVVRERAVASISKISQHLSENEINNFIIPMIIRLASNDNNFTNRVSATLLMCNIYPRAGPHKEKIRSKFMDISNEEMLLLQRVTATKLSQMCQTYEKQYVISDLISILKHRSTDEQDQIRVLACESFKAISKVLTRDENKTYIMPLIIQAADDKSWRVRLCLSKNFTEIAENFGKEIADLSLIQVFGHLLKDVEVDVKIEAVKSLDEFIKIVSPDKMSTLVQQVVALGKDPLSIVRCHSGNVLSTMIKYVPKDQVYQTIQPLIKDLMKDDSQEVRKGGILAAAKFIESMGADSIPSIHPSLKQCLEDKKWRVRLELLRNMADLSFKIHNPDAFIKYIEPLYSFFLNDRAAAIRKLGVEKLPEILKSYGKVYTQSLFARLSEILTKENSYHFKITALYAIKTIVLDKNNDGLTEKCIQLLIKSASDPVPNVREVCVKCYQEILDRSSRAEAKEPLKKQLMVLAQDTDFEVKERATALLARI